MKVLAGAFAFAALGISAADAATLNVVGSFNPSMLLSIAKHAVTYNVVPEPATWGLMILGFTFLARQVRVARKVKA